MDKFIKKNYGWIIAAIMTFFAVVSVLNAKNDTATFDEVAHIPAGYSYVTQHDMRLNPEHPPLLKGLIGAPLLFLNLNFDINNNFWTGEELNRIWDDGQWEAGKYLLYGAGNNPDQILFWARLPIILLSIILGLFLFKWGKEVAGIYGGLIALILYAFDPNILGHNHYVTTDLGIAAFITFAFYYFLKFIKKPSWTNVFLGGFFLGLMNLTKFSSLIAYPIFGLILFTYPLIKKISHSEEENSKLSLRLKTFFAYLGKGFIAFAFSMIVVWVGYSINTYEMPKEVIDRQINFSFPKSDPNPLSLYTNQALSYLNSSDLIRPLSEYFLGVTMVFKRVAGGNGTYFLQNVSSQASPIYFPFVFLTKETIPFLALILFSLAYAFSQTVKTIKSKETSKELKKFFQAKVVEYTLLSFIVFYSILSITGNLNIGLRHLFPIFPFIYLLISKKIYDFYKKSHIFTKHNLRIYIVIILTWIILIPVFSYPGYVSYFNESVGGSKNGYKYVTDSNTDWGQDLGRLKKFLDKNPQINKIRVDYFGGGNPEYYLGDKYISWWDSKRPVESGWYAISANALQTSKYNKEKNRENNYLWTNDFQPVGMIGNSILLYYISAPPIE